MRREKNGCRLAPRASTVALLLVISFDAAAASSQLAASGVNLALHIESLGDSVDFEPNLPEGGTAEPTSRQRLLAGRLELSWRGSGLAEASAHAEKLALTTKRDSLEIDGATVHFDWPVFKRTAHISTRVTGTASGHRADAFERTSFTEVDDATVIASRVNNPSDLKVGLGLSSRWQMSPSVHVNGALGAGWTRVRHSSLRATAVDRDGCRYQLESDASSSTLTLAEPCGSLHSFEQRWPDEEGFDQRYGIAPRRDLNWDGRWVEVALGAALTQDGAQLAINWRWHRISRDGIDERIEATGTRALRSAATLSLDAAYPMGEHVHLHASGRIHSRPWMADAPLLYNRFTAERQDKRIATFNLGVSVQIR